MRVAGGQSGPGPGVPNRSAAANSRAGSPRRAGIVERKSNRYLHPRGRGIHRGRPGSRRNRGRPWRPDRQPKALRGTAMVNTRMIAAAAGLALAAGAAQAQEVKVGVVLPYTGIGAEFAQLADRGMELYLKLNPDAVKPYTIKIIKRDDKNPSGADSKIATQELLTQD